MVPVGKVKWCGGVLKAPFPYFGGKSRVADTVWSRFGDVPNYCEPFFGSGAVLLGRRTEPKIETVNDKDCMVSNFFRAVQQDPKAVAKYADQPVNEADLIARHKWLKSNVEFQSRMKSDPMYFDVRIAGWWAWGMSCWIGSGWCFSENVDMKLPHLGGGEGINRRRSNFKGDPIIDFYSGVSGDGIHRYMEQLSLRMRKVRVACGDWSRICGHSPTVNNGLTGVFLDPPYASGRSRTYASDDMDLTHTVRKWALDMGDNPKMRIALCGYEEHDRFMPQSWERFRWKATGGFGNQGDDGGRGRENASKETIYFSPFCLKQSRLF